MAIFECKVEVAQHDPRKRLSILLPRSRLFQKLGFLKRGRRLFGKPLIYPFLKDSMTRLISMTDHLLKVKHNERTDCKYKERHGMTTNSQTIKSMTWPIYL